jgi:hypothetical protein
MDQLVNPARGSVSVVGERRIGKTSLLHYVSAPEVIKRWNADAVPSIFLYRDCGTITRFTITRFWKSILEQFEEELVARQLGEHLQAEVAAIHALDEITFDDVIDLLRSIERANLLLVLLLDEFEFLIRTDTPDNLAQTRDFLAGMRGLINQPTRVFSLIVATRRPLASLCEDIPFMGSPFYNNFVNVQLRPFSQREAESLIDQMLAGTDVRFTRTDKRTVFDLAGTHPLLVQAAAACIFDLKSSSQSRDLELVTYRFTELVQQQFVDLWRSSHLNEKEILVLLAGASALANERLAKLTSERQSLESRGLIMRGPTHEYGLFSSTFMQWLNNHLYELDGGRWQTVLATGAAERGTTIDARTVLPPRVFVSYSHADETEKNQLLTQLRVLELGAELLGLWSDDRIGGGDDWQAEIEEAMNAASVAILLVSANFLTSEFILGREVPELLRRREAEGLRVIPVIAKPCAWREVAWLRSMNCRPRDGRPVWREAGIHADEELARIAEEVARSVRS